MTGKVEAIVLDRIMKSIESGVVPWRKSWVSGMPRNLFSGRYYHGVNILMLGDGLWASFKEISEHGGRIKPKEERRHGSQIVVFYKQIKTKDVVTDAIGRVMVDSEGNPVHRTFPLLRYYTVFNAEDTTGLEKYIAKRTVARSNNPIADAEAVIRKHNPTVRAGEPAYHPGLDFITMPGINQFESADKYYNVMFHEMGHWTGAVHRLNRAGVAKHTGVFDGQERYSFEELIAEIASAFASARLGISVDVEQSAAYVAGWARYLKGAPAGEIVKAASAADKATVFLLGEMKDDGAGIVNGDTTPSPAPMAVI